MKRKVYLWVFLILTLSGLVVFGLTQFKYSKGVRSGKLVKLSKVGVMLATYEGTLDLGSGNQLTWDFSVHNKEVAKKLVKLSGREVKLEYRKLLFPLIYGTKYDVHQFSEVIQSGSNELFCRLVNLMRKNHHVVQAVKKLIENNDQKLLEEVRRCQ